MRAPRLERHGVWIKAFFIFLLTLIHCLHCLSMDVHSVTGRCCFLIGTDTIKFCQSLILDTLITKKSAYKHQEHRALFIFLALSVWTLELLVPFLLSFKPTTKYVRIVLWDRLAQARNKCSQKPGNDYFKRLPSPVPSLGRCSYLGTYWDPGPLVRASSQVVFSFLPLSSPSCLWQRSMDPLLPGSVSFPPASCWTPFHQ